MVYNYSGRIFGPIEDENTSFLADARMMSIGYTDDCSVPGIDDPHVTYSTVITEYTDKSTLLSRYFDVFDYPDLKGHANTISDIQIH